MFSDDMLKDAEKEQIRLASEVCMIDIPRNRRQYVIGIDVSYDDDCAFGCAIVMDAESMKIVEKKIITTRCALPYISGFFYLREAPIIFQLLKSLDKKGVVLIDGNGILHPRRMGLASYIGVKNNIQTIGVAKTLMLGEIGKRSGKIAAVTVEGSELGAAIWLGEKTSPVYVSVGHRVSLSSAIDIVQKVSIYGNPEPLRQAHLCSRELSNQQDR